MGSTRHTSGPRATIQLIFGQRALVILAIGVVMSVFMSRVITRPVESFQRAAASLQAGNYQPGLLSDLGAITADSAAGDDEQGKEAAADHRRGH